MTVQTGYRVFIEAETILLRDRGLEAPDGRPLYQYRISDSEFSHLKELLTIALSRGFGLSITARLTGFSSLFVLYAAEWWRRGYNGSGFSWEPMLYDISADPAGWSQQERSECVTKGLREWRLNLLTTSGMRFLGTIAVNGGIPLQLLASARGKIGQLLQRVLQLSGGVNVSQAQLHDWVESLAHLLPLTYRRSEIYTLLADIAWTTLRLKEEAGLVSSKDAVAMLDQKIHGWRERYPLPMEDNQAQGLIEQLIKDVVTVKAQRQISILPVERYLERDEQGWSLRSRLQIPDDLPLSLLSELFHVDKNELPRTAQLSLNIAGEVQSTSLRQLAGHSAYRSERRSWGTNGAAVADEHLLTLNAPDGRCWSATAVRGNALSLDLPWIFAEDQGQYKLVRQGSGGIAATEAIVLLPTGWQLDAENEAAELVGHLETPASTVIKTGSELHAHKGAELVFRLRTGQASAQDDMVVLIGNRSWLAFESPALAFKGQPQLQRHTTEGAQLGKIEGSYTVLGAPTSSKFLGPVQLRYPAKGDIRFRSRLVLLPVQAEVEPEFMESHAGLLRFKKWQATSARVLSPVVTQHSELQGEDLVLHVSAPAGTPLPELLQLEVRWGHTSYPVKLAMPFPAKGVRAFGADGSELRAGSTLAIQEIMGARIRIALGSENTRSALELVAGNNSTLRNVRKYALQTPVGSLHIGIRLLDYIDDIQQLLSTDDSTDARVNITVKVSGAAPFALQVARYAAHIERQGSVIALEQGVLSKFSSDDIAALPMMALRLEEPADEALRLEALTSEGVPNATWDFTPALHEPGSWLVYPGSDSKLPFRPTLCPIVGDRQARSQLATAFSMPVFEERVQAIDAIISSMATDFNHVDWAPVEQLINQVGHLPLPTLDLWKRFVHSPEGMAALALRLNKLPTDFLERFAYELPCAWEIIPLNCWQIAMLKLKKQCEAISQAASNVLFQQHLTNRLNDLTANNGALAYTLGIASSMYLETSRKSTVAVRHFGTQLYSQLFMGPESDYMKLLQQHADDTWPMELEDYVKAGQKEKVLPDYLYTESNYHQLSTVNLPIILAVQVATGKTDEWFRQNVLIHYLRKYRAFDRSWFIEAFNRTLARCMAEGLIKLDTESK